VLDDRRLTPHEIGLIVGCSATTVRRMEEKGLIERAERDNNGYRWYSPHAVDQARAARLNRGWPNNGLHR
jgi:DNA-binding transcriptional MerR regulator